MNTEFRHTRAYGLTSREFAKRYRPHDARANRRWWAIITVNVLGLFVIAGELIGYFLAH